MSRETKSQSLVISILFLFILIMLIMIYWSSTLVEEDVNALRIKTEEFETDLNNLQSEIRRTELEILEATQRSNQPSSENPSHSSSSTRPHIDPNLPNLLTEDPFYATTLPKMLGPNFKPQGTFHSAVVTKPENLHFFSNWAQVIGWISQCSVTVARQKFGIYETFAPDMAIKIEERKNAKTDKNEFWVHLRKGVFWQPLRREWFPEHFHLSSHFLHKHPVTAHDFKFYLDAVMNPFLQEDGAVALRNYLSDIEELEVIDDLTFVVRWKYAMITEGDGKVVSKMKYVAKLLTGSLRPLPSFVYKYFADGTKIIEEDSALDAYRTNSVWAQNFSQHWAKNIIVSCGPWIFEEMTDRQIRFRRNPDHYFPLEALVADSQTQFKDSPDNIWSEFKENNLDTYEMRPDQLLELESFLASDAYKAQKSKNAAINRLDFISRSYVYIGWNEAKPYFSSKKVRQALTMAIDRKRIINQFLNGMGIEINGPFYLYSPDYDPSIPFWPFDPLQARQLLEEEGWYDSTGTGIIDKLIDGKRVPFQISLTYYVKNPTSKVICEYVSTALKQVGIASNLNGVDIADLSAAFEDKTFDALCMGWGLGTPPEDPRQLWHSSGAKEKGSSNSVGFANAEVDAIINALDYESDPKRRIELYHRFDAIIHEEAPYTFLYTPKSALIYRERVQGVFIPAEKQDLIPGANVGQPDSSTFWLLGQKGKK